MQATEWQEFISMLEAERNAYAMLLTLLQEEQGLLERFAHQQLLDLAGRKEDILARLSSFEQTRQTVMASILGTAVPSHATSVEEHLSRHRHAMAREAATRFQEVIELARRAKIQGRKNTALVHRGLATVREALRLIYAGIGQEPVYGESGTLQFAGLSSSVNVTG